MLKCPLLLKNNCSNITLLFWKEYKAEFKWASFISPFVFIVIIMKLELDSILQRLIVAFLTKHQRIDLRKNIYPWCPFWKLLITSSSNSTSWTSAVGGAKRLRCLPIGWIDIDLVNWHHSRIAGKHGKTYWWEKWLENILHDPPFRFLSTVMFFSPLHSRPLLAQGSRKYRTYHRKNAEFSLCPLSQCSSSRELGGGAKAA